MGNHSIAALVRGLSVGVVTLAFAGSLVACQATANPTPTPMACNLAFDAAEAQSVANGSAQGLYPAVHGCTIDEWRAEFTTHSGIGWSGDADSLLRSTCSGGLEAEPLCAETRPLK
jgi:hypothetical protein